MEIKELYQLAKESESRSAKGVRLVVPGLFKSKYVKITPNLSGKNLGWYPEDFEKDLSTTHVFVKNSAIFKYCKSQQSIAIPKTQSG
jgi:hypothetical protein